MSRIPRELPFPPVHANLASARSPLPKIPVGSAWLGMRRGKGWGSASSQFLTLLPRLHPARHPASAARGEEGCGPRSARGAVGSALTRVMALALLANCLFSPPPALGSARHSRSPPARRPQRPPKPASQLASAAPPPRLVLAIPPGLYFTRGSPLNSWGSALRPSLPFLHGAEHPEQHPWLDTGDISLRPLLPHSWSRCHQHEPHALPIAGLVQGQPL